MRERTSESRATIWVLITDNRWLIAGLLFGATFLIVVLLGRFGPGSPSKFFTADIADTMFSSIIIAVITSVTLVLTVAQLALSQEIGSLGEQWEKMEAEDDFRTTVEETPAVSVSPAEPSAFLRTLIEIVENRSQAVEDAVSEHGDGMLAAEVSSFTDHLTEHSQAVSEDLAEAEFGTFEVLLPVLNYNYSWKLFAARELRAKYAESLSDDADSAFENLIDVLGLFGPAREYFKAQYFQWEIITVSRAMLAGAMPALAIAAYMILLFDPSAMSGTVIRLPSSFLFIALAYSLTLAPFALLLAYLLRVLTIVRRTLAIGPFILRETKHNTQIRQRE